MEMIRWLNNRGRGEARRHQRQDEDDEQLNQGDVQGPSPREKDGDGEENEALLYKGAKGSPCGSPRSCLLLHSMLRPLARKPARVKPKILNAKYPIALNTAPIDF